MYMKQIFPSIISEDILNFVAFQLLHCFLQICLICCLKMKRHEVRKNFMRFGSTRRVCFLIISVFVLMGHLNIVCQLFKNLTVEAHMENYVTLEGESFVVLLWKSIALQKRRASDQNWIDLNGWRDQNFQLWMP